MPSKKSKEIRLNLGSGSNRIEGFINVDVEPSVKPDVLCDFVNKQLPYKAASVTEVVLFHTIEHLPKRLHKRVLAEIWRVLKPGGSLLISYPEFTECVRRWKTNYAGKKDFWEKTIYGRQLYPSDFHVALMHTPDFVDFLRDQGFRAIKSSREPLERHNTVVSCVKGLRPPNYVDLIRDQMDRFELKK